MNMMQYCPMMLTKYPSYNRVPMANYNPCASCLYRTNINGMNSNYDSYMNSYMTSNNPNLIYPEMRPVALEEIAD